MLAREWNVTVRRVRTTPTSVIAFGFRHGDPVVLKMVTSPGDEWESGRATAAFDGHGMVRVLERLGGAVLLEELRPGTRLSDRLERCGDIEATAILGGVALEMWRASPPLAASPTAEDWGAAFGRYIASRDERIPGVLVRRAWHCYAALCRSQTEVRLLHGDLQHYNILFSADRGWVAIDPKGVVAEREFEFGAALRNPRHAPELHTRSSIERRVRQMVELLGVDRDRVLAWAFAQAVLSAIWTLEDEGGPDGTEPALRVAEALMDVSC